MATLAELQALERAIATGARVVEHGGHRVEYRSLTEMEATASRLRLDLGIEPPPSAAARQSVRRAVAYTRGD